VLCLFGIVPAKVDEHGNPGPTAKLVSQVPTRHPLFIKCGMSSCSARSEGAWQRWMAPSRQQPQSRHSPSRCSFSAYAFPAGLRNQDRTRVLCIGAFDYYP